MHPTRINDKKELTKANGLVAVRNQSSSSKDTLSEKALRTPADRQPPRPLYAPKSGCQSRHYVVVCFHRKMEWHFNALGSGHVQSAASSIFIRIRIMGMGSSPRSSMASAQIDPKLQHLSIALKELIPVVLAAVTFGCQWSGKVVQFVVDNFSSGRGSQINL